MTSNTLSQKTSRRKKPEAEVKPEVLANEETSSITERENSRSITFNPQNRVEPVNQIQITKDINFDHKVHASPIPPIKSVGPSLPRPSESLVLRQWTYPASDVEQIHKS